MEPDATRGRPTVWLDERYHQIIEQVEDYAIFTVDNEGLVNTWNEGAEHILGFSEEEALGQPCDVIFTPEDREQGEPERERETARRNGKALDERWHVRKGGHRFYASGILTALYDNGNPDGFTKILRDLTQQQQAKEEREHLLGELQTLNETLEQRVKERTQELEASNEELRKSEQRFLQAFRSGPVASCLTTLGEERFLEVNDAFLELTGYSLDEVVGKSYKELGAWSTPEDLAKLRRFGEEPFRNQELTLRTRRGGVREVLLSREVIGLDDERVNLKQFYDVTERKQNEKQLKDALQRVMSDTSWFAQKVMEEIAQVKIGSQESFSSVDLSKREREVLERLARGASNEVIAKELSIAVQTVRNYVSLVYDKLGVHTRGEAIIWARERGIA